MDCILLGFLFTALRVADFAEPPAEPIQPPPLPGDNIWDVNLRLFPSLNVTTDAERSGATTFKDGVCVPMQGHCLGEDDKTSNLGTVILIKTTSPLVCREECKKNVDIGGCEFKREKKGTDTVYTCTKFGGIGIKGDKSPNAKCWNMLKCGKDNKMKLVEGDIVVTQNVKEVRSRKFDAIKNPRNKWPKRNGLVYIPYTMSLGSKAQGRVRWAVQHISATTCVRWVPRSNQRDYVMMFNGGGCYSMIGRQGNRQKLSLGAGCLYDSGTTVHEMLHAMGWYHEQSRDDRDRYIKIHWNNITPAMRYNFNKYNGLATTYGLKYDKKSVMQYGNRAFGIGGRVTMEDLASRGAQLGQRVKMTPSDIASVNLHYGCDCNKYNCKAPKEGTTGGGGTNSCVDKNRSCPGWADGGYCKTNPKYMHPNCPKSCKLCTKPKPKTTPKPTPKPTSKPGNCADRQPFCSAIKTFCTKNSWVKDNCKKSCGKCSRPPPVSCKDKKSDCGSWANSGYCKNKYKEYMEENCKKSCKVC